MERPAAALVRIRLQHKSEGKGGGKEGTAYLHTFNPLFLTLLDRVPSVATTTTAQHSSNCVVGARR